MSTTVDTLEEIQEPAEVFPEDSMTDAELIRSLREELAKQPIDANTTFRERQRQRAITEVVKERNEAMDAAMKARIPIVAEFVEHLFRVFYRDGQVNEAFFDRMEEVIGCGSFGAFARIRFDEDEIQNKELVTVFKKYAEMYHKDQETKALPENTFIPTAMQGAEDTREVITAPDWNDFINHLQPKVED